MTARRNQLRYLVIVAEEGQITSAARKLHLAQPALSQAIAHLEAELGIVLLKRHPRGVTLTAAGEAFLVKARAALDAETEAGQTAQWLARAARGALAVGFVGPPPAISTPGLFAALAASHPDANVSFHDLPFPRGATARWLADVDVALCLPAAPEDGLSTLAVRVEPRAAVVHRAHPLAGEKELFVEQVLNETFASYHPDVQRKWAGFHSLDDHRGRPPAHTTEDHALTSLQMLGVMTAGRALTTVPAVDAGLAATVLPEVAAIPIVDAAPAEVSLMWRSEVLNPLVDELLDLAREFGGKGGAGGV
jgi:DNA-binding transcriptional LysR family regulator